MLELRVEGVRDRWVGEEEVTGLRKLKHRYLDESVSKCASK